jgi:hypothetical protein
MSGYTELLRFRLCTIHVYIGTSDYIQAKRQTIF